MPQMHYLLCIWSSVSGDLVLYTFSSVLSATILVQACPMAHYHKICLALSALRHCVDRGTRCTSLELDGGQGQCLGWHARKTSRSHRLTETTASWFHTHFGTHRQGMGGAWA